MFELVKNRLFAYEDDSTLVAVSQQVAASLNINWLGFRSGAITCEWNTWNILGVVSKQLRLLHGRVGDSTTSVNSWSPQMSELVDDAVAS